MLEILFYHLYFFKVHSNSEREKTKEKNLINFIEQSITNQRNAEKKEEKTKTLKKRENRDKRLQDNEEQ